MTALREACVELARDAGQAIMAVYARDFEVEFKGDDSPLTQADMASHHVIVDGLRALAPDIPVLSEEDAGIAWETRRGWGRHWLVDPLDGAPLDYGRKENILNPYFIALGDPSLPWRDWLGGRTDG